MSNEPPVASQTDEPTVNPSRFDTEQPTVQHSLNEVTEAFEEMNRPSILQYQVDGLIAETLLSELHSEQLYEHVVDNDLQHRAWVLSDTASQAIVEITVTNDDDETRTHYALPPVGETTLDLRWWALNCYVNDRAFEIQHVSNRVVADLFDCTPPAWVGAIGELLDEGIAPV